MGGGASIVDLSSTELGEAVSKLGKHYELASKEIIDSGISGTILFQTVHDSEEQFKSFVAEHFNITKPLLQTVLFTSYAGLLQNDGSSGKSISSLYDIKETLQRPPRQILSDLFQIQGIKLDPENVAGAVDDIAAAIHESIGEDTICDGINSFHCFIGYRVLADKVIAESLYDKLTVRGFKPFLDKFKLKNGLPWKDGFLQGLKGSKCFVSLISSGALSLCRDKSRNHTWDNYLLEIETALQYVQASGNSAYIIPIHIGEMVTVDGRTLLAKFGDFASSLHADTIEGTAVPSHDAQEKAHAAQIKEVADIRAKAKQEALEIRQKAERDAAATTAAAAAVKSKSEQEAKAVKDKASQEAAALKAKAEQEAREVREKAERDAKAVLAAGAKSTTADATVTTSTTVAGQQIIGTKRVQIDGATGVNAAPINGEYEPTNELSGGVTAYRKTGDKDRWLEYNAGKTQWQCVRTGLRGTSSFVACCVVPTECLPDQCPVGKWQVDMANVGAAKLTEQASVTITSV